jgi:hypothetical protein
VGRSKTSGEQGSTISLNAALQPGHWLRALIYYYYNYNNNNNNMIHFNKITVNLSGSD